MKCRHVGWEREAWLVRVDTRGRRSRRTRRALRAAGRGEFGRMWWLFWKNKNVRRTAFGMATGDAVRFGDEYLVDNPWCAGDWFVVGFLIDYDRVELSDDPSWPKRGRYTSVERWCLR